MLETLEDMEILLASDEHFLLGNWINEARSRGFNEQESDLYELNARSQITIWGTEETLYVTLTCKNSVRFFCFN